jgi:UDP-N-acetylmuramoyl-tripeptide--D-alanyl-D-alanine ligase
MSGRITIGRFVDAIEAAGAPMTVLGGALRRDVPFDPSTDSRTIERGQTFVCLRGPRFDGHDHIEGAVRRGAAAIVADDAASVPPALPVPVLVVADAKAAYLRGAAAVRASAACTVVAVTGSVGKTTTTSFCAQLLRRTRRVLATPGNENNELGVSKLCYLIDDDVDVAIVEMGARGPGQIAQLVEIARPDVGILTNVGEAHLEFFADAEQLALTKFGLFSGGAKPVLSAADEWSAKLAARSGIAKTALWVRLCGDPRREGLMLEAGEPRDGRVPVSFGASHAFARWSMAGMQHLRDALLAAGGAILAGQPFEETIAGLGDLGLPAGRFEPHALRSGATVIYDAYNASPASMAHALEAFAALPAARRFAVLGSMAELGADAGAMHEATGAAAARAGMDYLFCGGAFAQALAGGALRAGMRSDRVATFAGNAEIADVLGERLREGDAVLLKGSRVLRMEEILHRLTAAGAVAS